ncbi:IbrB-like domain-containing protein [Pseudocitrobacter cyperus]|uniref:ParB/RepB/Spo0J family partition protein n=1 Tax=Pseudocitrobacter cyperus TaxID=3112843 RepID=A0ABV0HHM0_9ENTR
MQQRLIADMEAYLQPLDFESRVEAINQLRLALHALSPFKDQPADCVLWVKEEQVKPNDYNPNNMAPPEKRLLQKSLEADGFTQPIVVMDKYDNQFEIVDGYHRYALSGGKAALKKQFNGYLPIARLENRSSGLPSRMAATIRHNRARGRHQVRAMSDIVLELSRLGWGDDRIGKELGMDSDEVLRLKQINGLLEMFGDRQFSQAWTVK